jgi:hypothetical protein
MQIIKIVHDKEIIDDNFLLKHKAFQFNIEKFFELNMDEIIKSAENHLKESTKPQRKLSQMENAIETRKSLLISMAIGAASAGSDNYRFNELENQLRKIKLRERFIATNTAQRMLATLTKEPSNAQCLTLTSAREQYRSTKNLAIGTYTFHPREPQMLTRLANFHKNLAMEKDDELVMLLGRMGAKTVEIIQSSDAENSASIDANTENFKIDARVATEFKSKINNKQHLTVKFEGHATEMPDDLLASSIWFADDSNLHSIYESRKFSQNSIINYTLINTYFDSFDFDFDIAAKFIKFGGDLKTEYQSIKNQSRTFKVEFSPREK